MEAGRTLKKEVVEEGLARGLTALLIVEAVKMLRRELVECRAEKLLELLTTTNALGVPDVECKADALATMVCVVVKDLVEVIVVYVVLVTLPVVLFWRSELLTLLTFGEMPSGPDADCSLDTFATVVDVISKDSVDTTVL